MVQVPVGVSLPVIMVNRKLLSDGFDEFQEMHDTDELGAVAESSPVAEAEAAAEAVRYLHCALAHRIPSPSQCALYHLRCAHCKHSSSLCAQCAGGFFCSYDRFTVAQLLDRPRYRSWNTASSRRNTSKRGGLPIQQ